MLVQFYFFLELEDITNSKLSGIREYFDAVKLVCHTISSNLSWIIYFYCFAELLTSII